MIADRLPPMRIGAIPDGLVERLGLLLGKLPTPIGESLFAMPVARSLQVAQRTGILGALAEGPREPGGAGRAPRPAGHRDQPRPRRDRHARARQAEPRRDLRDDRQRPPLAGPASDTYLGDFLADTAHYWEWYAGLEDLVRDGTHVELHEKGPTTPTGSPTSAASTRWRGSPAPKSRRRSRSPGAPISCSTSPAPTASTRWRSAAATRGCGRRSSTCPAAPGWGRRSSPKRG